MRRLADQFEIAEDSPPLQMIDRLIHELDELGLIAPSTDMRIGDLTPEQLHQRFSGAGVRVRIGPFIFHLCTPIREFVADFSFAYADFPICDESEVSDFRISRWRRLEAGGRGARRRPVLGRRHQPVRDVPPAARHAVCRMGLQLVHLQLCPSIPDVPLRRGREGRACCHSGGPAGFGKEHALCCFAGTGLAVVVGRVRLARSGARLSPADTAAGRTQGCFYRAGREIAAASAGSVASSPRHARARSRICARPPKRSSVRRNRRCRAGSCFRRMPKMPTRELVPLRKAAGFLRLEENCFNYDDARPHGVRCAGPID